MEVIIYNPNSFGGNYNYAHCILTEYQRREIPCGLVLPTNVPKSSNVARELLLLPDVPKTQKKLIKKMYFVWRSFINPFLFFKFLLFKKPSKVVFNDFDQLTAFIWVPFFFILRLKHQFAVILHDPDRDAYFPSTWLSSATMRCIMALMDWGMYHEILPKKWYYRNKVQYFSIPHGIYESNRVDDAALSRQLQNLQNKRTVCTILGNIRKEKNYEMAIIALEKCDNLQLLIAGKNASSGYTIEQLKALAKQLNVEHQITWLNHYLTDAEMHSVLQHTDVLLLNYSSSFTSQSGILNVAAPFAPHLLVSKTESALYQICQQFRLAEFIPADDAQALKEKFLEWDKNQVPLTANWEAYRAYASWENNISITLKHFEEP